MCVFLLALQETEKLQTIDPKNGVTVTVDPDNYRYFHIRMKGPEEVRHAPFSVLLFLLFFLFFLFVSGVATLFLLTTTIGRCFVFSRHTRAVCSSWSCS